MIIKSKYNLMDTRHHQNVIIGNNKIEQVRDIKYLGVSIDDRLTFSNHALYISNKIAKKVNFLRRIGKGLDVWTKLIIYETIIFPHLNFCSTILFLLNNLEINRIQKNQNRTLRVIILGCDKYTSIKHMLEVVDVLSAMQTILLNTFTFVYKILLGMLPQHLLENCIFVNEIHDHNTRLRDNFYIRNVNTIYSQNNLYHNGLKQYNNLPLHVKNCNSDI